MADDEETHADLMEEYHDILNSYIALHNNDDTCRTRSRSMSGNQSKSIMESFKSRGLKIRYGRWTFQEKKRFHKNFEEFVRNHKEEIGNPVEFVTPSDDKGRAQEVIRLKRDLDYYRFLSRGLFRERSNIVSHSRHNLDPLAVSNGQKYSVEDKHLLKSLVDKHGTKWKLISQEMGRSGVSVHSAHRNYFLHEGYTNEQPTKKHQRKLLKEMQKLYPEKDLTCELVSDVPWNSIANKIGFMHGKYLCTFWENRIKYLDDEGKLRLKMSPRHIPPKLLRQFVRHVSKQKPTHMDSLDWQVYYRMLSAYTPGVTALKHLLRTLLRRYKLSESELGLAKAVKQLNGYMKRAKKLGFQSIWEEIRTETLCMVPSQQYHWALSPDLAHYVHDMPTMYLGYAEYQSDDTQGPSEVKQEPIEMDEVW